MTGGRATIPNSPGGSSNPSASTFKKDGKRRIANNWTKREVKIAGPKVLK